MEKAGTETTQVATHLSSESMYGKPAGPPQRGANLPTVLHSSPWTSHCPLQQPLDLSTVLLSSPWISQLSSSSASGYPPLSSLAAPKPPTILLIRIPAVLLHSPWTSPLSSLKIKKYV